MAPNPSPRRRWGEVLAGRLIFPLWVRREHPAYRVFRRAVERSQFWPADQLLDLQRTRLRALLAHALQHSPFYRARLTAAGITTETNPESAAWTSLPLLTKADLKQSGPAMEATGLPNLRRYRNQTGGSTGTPVQYWVDWDRMSTRMASVDRHNAWAGLRPGDWKASVWGAPLEAQVAQCRRDRIRNALVYRSVNLNCSSIAPADWDRFFAEVRRRRPRYLLAYSSGADELAAEVTRRAYSDIQFSAIITSAEVLTAEQRQRIESGLGGKVFDRYGCREVSVIASECAAHTGLHVNAEALLVEIVPVPGMEPGWGKVVITDLLNRSQPLIRYENGDIARWAEGPCPCGRALPRLAEVKGRVADFIHLPGGRMVSGVAVLTLALAEVKQVRQLQLVERSPGDLQLRVVPGDSYGPPVRRELAQRLQRHLQGAGQLEVVEVDAIARAASGKYQFVVHESSRSEPAGVTSC